MTPAVSWAGGTMELPELDPPYAISSGLAACRELARALYDADLPHTRAAVDGWADGARGSERASRRDLVARAARFLEGSRLRDHEERYAEALAGYLERDPAPRAAAIAVAALAAREPTLRWTESPCALVSGWLSARAPSLRLP